MEAFGATTNKAQGHRTKSDACGAGERSSARNASLTIFDQ